MQWIGLLTILIAGAFSACVAIAEDPLPFPSEVMSLALRWETTQEPDFQLIDRSIFLQELDEDFGPVKESSSVTGVSWQEPDTIGQEALSALETHPDVAKLISKPEGYSGRLSTFMGTHTLGDVSQPDREPIHFGTQYGLRLSIEKQIEHSQRSYEMVVTGIFGNGNESFGEPWMRLPDLERRSQLLSGEANWKWRQDYRDGHRKQLVGLRLIRNAEWVDDASYYYARGLNNNTSNGSQTPFYVAHTEVENEILRRMLMLQAGYEGSRNVGQTTFSAGFRGGLGGDLRRRESRTRPLIYSNSLGPGGQPIYDYVGSPIEDRDQGIYPVSLIELQLSMSYKIHEQAQLHVGLYSLTLTRLEGLGETSLSDIGAFSNQFLGMNVGFEYQL